MKDLRETLATLYDTKTKAEILANDAGLMWVGINSDGSMVEVMGRLLNEARNHKKISAVLEVALREYPSNEILLEALRTHGETSSPLERVDPTLDWATPKVSLDANSWVYSGPVDLSTSGPKAFAQCFVNAYGGYRGQKFRLVAERLGLDMDELDFSKPDSDVARSLLELVARRGKLPALVKAMLSDDEIEGLRKQVADAVAPPPVAETKRQKITIVLEVPAGEVDPKDPEFQSRLLKQVSAVGGAGLGIVSLTVGSLLVTLEGPSKDIIRLQFFLSNGLVDDLLGYRIKEWYLGTQRKAPLAAPSVESAPISTQPKAVGSYLSVRRVAVGIAVVFFIAVLGQLLRNCSSAPTARDASVEVQAQDLTVHRVGVPPVIDSGGAPDVSASPPDASIDREEILVGETNPPSIQEPRRDAGRTPRPLPPVPRPLPIQGGDAGGARHDGPDPHAPRLQVDVVAASEDALARCLGTRVPYDCLDSISRVVGRTRVFVISRIGNSATSCRDMQYIQFHSARTACEHGRATAECTSNPSMMHTSAAARCRLISDPE